MKNDTTTRRTLLKGSAASLAALAAASAVSATPGGALPARNPTSVAPLTPPKSGLIPVAFPISDGAVLIDFAGPWEVFGNATLASPDGTMDMSGASGFRTFTVAERKTMITASGGMKITPDYTFENAPAAKVIVIPAQGSESDALLGWIRNAARTADMTMSVCTGAFVLAKTGLLSGKRATTHHGSYINLAMQYPDIRVMRGYRFVDEGNIASAGGLTCGIDLAMHVVERYYGRDSAVQAALNLEYQGKGWMDASGADNAYYAKPFAGNVCPVCGMAVDASLKSDFNGHTYYFCSSSHKSLFDKSPQAILDLQSRT